MDNEPSETTKLHLRIPKPINTRIDKMATEYGITRNAAVLVILADYFNQKSYNCSIDKGRDKCAE